MGIDQTNEEDRLKETNRVHSINESNGRINRKNEIYDSHKPVIFEDVDKIRKCICKIKIKYDSKESFGTGFFIDYNSFKYLITNYHIISKIIKNIEIEIWDKTIINFNLNNRYIIYLPKPKDISIIRIDPNEIKNIQYLFIDLNYSRGYHFYKNNEVFTASYPKGKKLASGSGIIRGIIKNGYEFYHNIPTEVGSSGSPIILFNTLTVIGIHKEADIDNKLNIGTFIGEVIKEINYKENNINNINLIENEAKENTINKAHIDNLNAKSKKEIVSIDLGKQYDDVNIKNEITCVYKVKEKGEINLLNDFNLKYRYINSEEVKKIYYKAKENINEENTDIFINDRKIKFNQKYKCEETGLIYVKFKFKQFLTSTDFMFYNCSSLKSVNLSSFNAKKLDTMNCMFGDCISLELIDLSSINIKNVTSIAGLFINCSSLKSIDLSSFNTSNIINMDNLFSRCSSLKSIDLSSFNTSKVTNMCSLFRRCPSLTSICLSSFNTRNVIDMEYMFFNCSSLKSIDLSSFDTSNVTNMRGMFDNCSSLKSIDLSSFNTKNVENMIGMFRDCSSLISLDLSSFNTSKVTNMKGMFYNCSLLKSLDLSSFDTKNVENMIGMFRDCSSLESLNLSSFITKNVKTMNVMFRDCSSLESLDLSSFDTNKVIDMTAMFFRCSSLKSIDLSLFDTSNLKFKNYMFNLCSSLEKQNIKVGQKGKILLDEYDNSIIFNAIKYLFEISEYSNHLRNYD